MVLAQLGLGDNSDAFQRRWPSRIQEWESYGDSHNGDWGPSAMALALDAYGAHGYEVRGFETRQGALRDAARAIQATGAPVILLAWRGAHTWVMTGFRADADPASSATPRSEGAYILDPWYPWISSIWGRSGSARHVPGRRRDDPQLPAMEPARGQATRTATACSSPSHRRSRPPSSDQPGHGRACGRWTARVARGTRPAAPS